MMNIKLKMFQVTTDAKESFDEFKIHLKFYLNYKFAVGKPISY